MKKIKGFLSLYLILFSTLFIGSMGIMVTLMKTYVHKIQQIEINNINNMLIYEYHLHTRPQHYNNTVFNQVHTMNNINFQFYALLQPLPDNHPKRQYNYLVYCIVWHFSHKPNQLYYICPEELISING